MRVLVAGASGVVGRQLVPALETAGHDVIGLARTTRGKLGRGAVAVDVLDRDAVIRAVDDSAPDAIVNMLTAIPARINPKRIDRDFAMTNRLRTEGTENLLHAAKLFGVSQIVAQGLAYAYDPHGAGPANEDTPLWRDPPQPFAPVLDGLKQLEASTLAAQGTVLRLGHLYGPGTSYASDGSFVHDVRRGRVPLVGGGTATFSFTHTRDVAAAVVSALTMGLPGVFNIVEDEPAQMHEWLPFLSRTIGAPDPRRVPTLMARFAVGTWGIAFMTQLRGADNARAKRLLKWQPKVPTWRNGFASELADIAAGH